MNQINAYYSKTRSPKTRLFLKETLTYETTQQEANKLQKEQTGNQNAQLLAAEILQNRSGHGWRWPLAGPSCFQVTFTPKSRLGKN